MDTSFLSRVRDAARASSGETLLLAILAAVVVGGSVLVYARTTDPPAPPVKHIPARPAQEEAPADRLVVHVAGMVISPGVYHLPDGSRVKDAITAAGGAAQGANVDALNLAAPVSDGQKIVVPKEGEALPAGEEPSADAKVNLNTATKEQLEELPSVGPVLAQRILDFRTKRGPFKSVRQLMEVDGFGPKKYESLKDLVTV